MSPPAQYQARLEAYTISVSWRMRRIALAGGISVYPALPGEKQAMEITENHLLMQI